MEGIWFYSGGYYIWWMFVNGIIYFFESLFLQNASGIRKKWHTFCYLLLSLIFTFLVMRFEIPSVFRLVLHTGMAVCFSVFFLRLKGIDAWAYVAVILTMCTFMEGFQAALMQWFVQQSIGPFMGAVVQMAVSGGLALLLAGSLCLVFSAMSSENRVKKQYLEEAKQRNEQYRSFQHDIDNHILVLSGLLHEKRYGEAQKYVRSLGNLSDDLIIRTRTGNLAADVLLKEKISVAESKGIPVRCNVRFPERLGMEDVDLCILLSNAIDNAIQACERENQTEESRMRSEISITAGMRQYFLFVNVTNSAVNSPSRNDWRPFGEKNYGTGLKNIKRIVKKYKGTMETEKSSGGFSLTALLCLKPSVKEE